jgi:hypothetical protein
MLPFKVDVPVTVTVGSITVKFKLIPAYVAG